MKLKVRPSMFSHTDNGCMMSRFQNIYCQNHDPNVFYFSVSEKLRLLKKNMCSSWLMQNQRQAQNNYWKCYEVWTQLHHNLFYILLTQIPNYKITKLLARDVIEKSTETLKLWNCLLEIRPYRASEVRVFARCKLLAQVKLVTKVGYSSWRVLIHGSSQPEFYKIKFFFSVIKRPY